jgi:hypothetical protein
MKRIRLAFLFVFAALLLVQPLAAQPARTLGDHDSVGYFDARSAYRL